MRAISRSKCIISSGHRLGAFCKQRYSLVVPEDADQKTKCLAITELV
jgi:hypothetical protein